MLVSIITVTLNSEKHLRQTIRSVCSQTYKQVEYIIIDGGSSDNTLSVIKQHEPLFAGSMKWVSEPDRGIYDAMNKGIALANGKIIGIVNSDDFLDPQAIENIVSAYHASGEKEAVYVGPMVRVNKEGLVLYHKPFFSQKRFESILRIAPPISHPAMFVPATLYKKHGSFDASFDVLADYEFMLRLSFREEQFIFLNSEITYFREGGVSERNLIKRTIESYRARKPYFNAIQNAGFTLVFLLIRIKGMFLSRVRGIWGLR